MLITSDKEAAMQTTPPLTAELNTYGFPQGYFILRSLATDRVLDVAQGLLEDGTCVILWPMTETSLVECKFVNSMAPLRAAIHKIGTAMRKPDSNNQVCHLGAGLLARAHVVFFDIGLLHRYFWRIVFQVFGTRYR